MGITGDFRELEALHAKVREAARGGLKERLLKAAATAALTEAQLGFRESVDPTGMPWAPLKFRTGKPLRDTGRLANSFTSRPTERGFVVGTNVSYAATHQYGATIVPKNRKELRFKGRGKGWIFAKRVVIPARPMVPWPHLSEKWSIAIKKAVDGSFEKYFAPVKK